MKQRWTAIMDDNLLHVVLLILLLIIFINREEKQSSALQIIAHRGASQYAPEHTAAAFDIAILMRADYIEMDVQLSKDNYLVVVHDKLVNRTTNGTGEINDLTVRQLKSLDAGSWFHPRYTGEKILTLNEVIDRYHKKVKFLIEIKNQKENPHIENILVQTLLHHFPADKLSGVIVQSFDYHSVKKIKKLVPQIQTGLLLNIQSSITKDSVKEWAKHVNYVNPHFLIINKQVVNVLHDFGLKVFPWVISNKKMAYEMISFHVDGIITNDPKIRQQLKSLCYPSIETQQNQLIFPSKEGDFNNFFSILEKVDYQRILSSLRMIVDQLIVLADQQSPK